MVWVKKTVLNHDVGNVGHLQYNSVKKNESSPLYILSKKESNDYRSFPYDPIRSKTNVVRFRTIRIVRKRTMTCRHKKYTKK